MKETEETGDTMWKLTGVMKKQRDRGRQLMRKRKGKKGGSREDGCSGERKEVERDKSEKEKPSPSSHYMQMCVYANGEEQARPILIIHSHSSWIQMLATMALEVHVLAQRDGCKRRGKG